MVNNKAINNFTGVQASGVIIDCLLRQCCFVWSEIIGPSLRKRVRDSEEGKRGDWGEGEGTPLPPPFPFSLPTPPPLFAPAP